MTQSKCIRSSKKIKTNRQKRSRELVTVRSKVSPQLTWIYPYLKKAKVKMPSLMLPKQVRPFKPTRTKIMRVLGNVYFAKKVIVIATHTQVTYLNKKGELKVKKIIKLPKSRMLDTLAHELAHFKYPEHGYEHEQFTKIIFKTFNLTEKCPHCRGSGKKRIGG